MITMFVHSWGAGSTTSSDQTAPRFVSQWDTSLRHRPCSRMMGGSHGEVWGMRGEVLVEPFRLYGLLSVCPVPGCSMLTMGGTHDERWAKVSRLRKRR